MALRILKSTRLWGLLGTAAVLWFICFKVFGKADVSWFMPDTRQIARAVMDVWPKMPFFAVDREPAPDGKGEIIYYTVPTRQFSQKELAQMGVTNVVQKPAPPATK